MSKQMERAGENAGFLDGRDYTAAFLYEFFSLIVGNGVYLNELAPIASDEDMSVTIGPGHAWINGVLYKNEGYIKIPLATADGSLNRCDSVHIRLNLSLNEAYAIGITGAYATNPTEAEVVRNAETYDLKICDVDIPAGCTKITQSQIIDRRLDKSVCGIPVFPVEHLDMGTFYSQIRADLDFFRNKEQASFVSWVEQMQAYVDKQQAAFNDFFAALTEELSVYTYIQEYTNEVTLAEDTNTVYIGIDDFVADEDVLFVSVNGCVCAASGYTVSGTGAEAYVVLKEARVTGDTVEFRVLKSKIGSAPMASTFVLVDADGTVLTDGGAALIF